MHAHMDTLDVKKDFFFIVRLLCWTSWVYCWLINHSSHEHVHIQESVAKPGYIQQHYPDSILNQFSSQNVFFLPSTLPFLFHCSEAMDSLKSVIDASKSLKVTAVRPLVLAAEENLHKMVVDLDKVVTKVGGINLFPFLLRDWCSDW